MPQRPPIGIAFDGADSLARDRLIVLLFTAGRNSSSVSVRLWQATREMLLRILAADIRPTSAPAGSAAIRPAPAETRLDKVTLVPTPATGPARAAARRPAPPALARAG